MTKRLVENRIKTADKIIVPPSNGDVIAVLPDTDRKGAQIVKERVAGHVAGKEIVVAGKICNLSFLFGTVTFPEDGKSADELISIARRNLGE